MLLELWALAAVADDDQLRHVGEPGAGEHKPVCLDEVGAAFSRLELGGEQDDGPVGIEVELAKEIAAARVRFPAASGEEGVVDGVGHGELRDAGAEIVRPVAAVVGADGQDRVDHGLECAEEEGFRGELGA